MSSAGQPAITTDHLERLITQSLVDLKRAREAADTGTAGKAERRMNALLDQLFKRIASQDQARQAETALPQSCSG